LHNIENRRVFSVHSIGSVDCFNPLALLREGASMKLKPDLRWKCALMRVFRTIQYHCLRESWEKGNKNLVSCLWGKTRAVLEGMQNLENFQFEELKSKLELRFGETYLLQNYYSQFNRKQKFEENIISLGSDIERLSQLTYPYIVSWFGSRQNRMRAICFRSFRRIYKKGSPNGGDNVIKDSKKGRQ